MSWNLILKAGIGNVTDRFFRDDVPSKEDINNIKDKESSYATLDTTLQDIKEQYASSKEGNDIPDRVVTRLLTGRRSKLSENREEALKLIGQRIEKWEKVREMFGMSNPLADSESMGIKYSDLVSPEGKTDKKWTIEVVQALHDMVANQTIEEPLDDIENIKPLLSLYQFITDITGGDFTKANRWQNKIGKDIPKNKNFLENLKKLLLHKENSGEVEKIARYFGLNVYARSEKTPEEASITVRSKTGGEDITRKRKGIANPKDITIAPKHLPTYIPATNLNTKLDKLTLYKFRQLVNKINDNNAGDGLTPSLSDKSIDIIHDTLIRPNVVKVDELVENIDLGRKGIKAASRRRKLSEWARDYLVGREYDADIETYDVPKYPKEGAGAKSDEMQLYMRALDRNQAAERKQLDRFIAKVNSQRNPEYENWIRWNEEGAVRTSIASTIQTDISLDAILNTLNPAPTSKFRKNILGILFLSFIEAENIQSYRDRINDLITSEDDFTQYIPSGKIFADTTETSFVSSMQAMLTFIIRVFGEDSVNTYNEEMAQVRDNFWTNIRQESIKVAEKEGLEYPEDKQEIINEIFVDGDYSDENKTSYFGSKENLDNSFRALQELLLDLKTSYITELFNIINKVGKDTQKYSLLKRWLLSNKYLKVTQAPPYFEIGKKKFKLISDPNYKRSAQNFEYVVYTTKGGKEELGKEKLNLTIEEILGDADE